MDEKEMRELLDRMAASNRGYSEFADDIERILAAFRELEEERGLLRTHAHDAEKAFGLYGAAQNELAALAAENERLRAALRGFLDIANGSTGVDGWHLNGDLAEWDEFEEPKIAESLLAGEAAPDTGGEIAALTAENEMLVDAIKRARDIALVGRGWGILDEALARREDDTRAKVQGGDDA